MDVEVDLESLQFDIKTLFGHGYLDDESLQSIYHHVGHIGYASLRQRQLATIISNAIEEACRLLGIDTNQPDAPIDLALVPRIDYYVHQHVMQFMRTHGLAAPPWPLITLVPENGMEDIHSSMFGPVGPLMT